jgi:hypothetical protein
MTGVTFFKMIQHLGLSVEWVAESLGVTVEEVNRYGERDKVPTPAERTVLESQYRQDLHAREHVREILKLIQEQGGPEEIVLVDYPNDKIFWRYEPYREPTPAKYHAKLVSRIATQLARKGLKCWIKTLDVEQYEAWRGNRKDSSSLRSRWAAEASMGV